MFYATEKSFEDFPNHLLINVPTFLKKLHKILSKLPESLTLKKIESF